MQLTTREAERIFAKLAVEVVESTHHNRGFVTHNGVRLLPVFYSRGNKAMPGNVPRRFAKSLMLTADQFVCLKQCTMTKNNYFDVLRLRGVIPDAPEGS